MRPALKMMPATCGRRRARHRHGRPFEIRIVTRGPLNISESLITRVKWSTVCPADEAYSKLGGHWWAVLVHPDKKVG